MNVLAQAAGDGNISQTFILIGITALFFYFIIWRPDHQRRKKMKYLRDHLKKGDTVIAMGIRATVDEIKDSTVILRQVDGSKVEMIKGAISQVESTEAVTEE